MSLIIKIGEDSMYQNLSREQTLLKISVYGALVFAISGIVVGLLSGAQMILFDGLYSLISLSLSVFSLLASRFMNKVDLHNYPFGKDKIEPLVILIKYFVILILVIGSFLSAVVALFAGGRDIELTLAVIYSVIGTLLCVGITYYIKKEAKTVKSGLLQAEGNQWFMDSLVSVGVLFGFILSLLLLISETTAFIVPYVDPIMVILVSIYFVQVPVSEMGTALRELLDMPPKGKVPDQIKAHAKRIKAAHGFEEVFTRVSKVGQTLWIEIDFVVAKNEGQVETVNDQDIIREDIEQFLKQYSYEIWLTVSFTENRKWAI